MYNAVQDLTDCERDYIRCKLGPDNMKWAKSALKMADKMGPVSGGEIFHNCDCMEYSCFCGQVTHLGSTADDIHAPEEESQESGSDSDWTICSEEEFEELQQKEGCACNERQCSCGDDCSVRSITQELSAMSM